jgi:hypothetical protein
MLYAALTLWLLVIVFSAWGVHRLWSRMIKPRAVNTVLLPGTLVAQLGHVLGLLITGNSVRNTSLMGDDEEGEPTTDSPDKQRIPIVGPVLVGLLPLVACAACLYLAARTLGRGVLIAEPSAQVPQVLPLTMAGIWDLLRTSITVSQNMLDAILASDLLNWANVLFLYLAVCLTVRMTPFEGNRRGAIAAIFLSGLVIGLVASLVSAVQGAVLSSWPILSFAVGMLLFLLLVSLLVSGVVGLIRILARNE